MSSVSRAGPRGGKGAAKATDTSGSGSKSQKTDTKSDSSKTSDLNPKSQPTAEQMRLAEICDTPKTDDLKHKIKQVMDATRKSEDEVCTALYDCDNDLDRAVNMLLEGEGQGEWVTSGNKKKNRHPGSTATSTRGEKSDNARDRSEPGETGPDRERSRNRGGGPPRMRGRGSSDSRGWRGRENKENEKNLQEGEGGREGGPPGRRGGGGRMSNGPGRSGRGGRGGRSGPRTFQSREKSGPGFPRSIDTWNNPHGEAETSEAPANGPDYGGGENWDDGFPSPEDWDNEEYTGSLADTKVFTASTNVSSSSHMAGQASSDQHHDTSNSDLAAAASSLPVISPNNSLETAASMLPSSLTGPMPVGQASQASGKSLTPAQSQYLSQLASQTSLKTENLKAAVGMAPGGASNGPKEPTSYVSAVNAGSYSNAAVQQYQASAPTPTYTATTVSYAASTYGSAAAGYKGPAPSMSQHQQQQAPPQQQQSMQSRPKNQRPRVPPPSKIPSSAVEMPGDAANSNINFLDLQFGGLEFGSDSNSFDFTSNASSNEPVNKYQQSATAVSGHESSQQVGNTSVGVPLDLSSMGMSKAQQTPQQVHQSQQAVTGLESYASASNNQTNQSGQSMASAQHAKDLSQASSLSSAISHSQKLGGSDSMTFPSQVSEHKSQQANVATSYSQSRGGAQSGNSAALDMVKSETTSTSSLSYPNSSTSNNASYQSSYQKPSSVYQSSTNYSSSAVNSSGSGGGGGGGTTGYSQGNTSAANQYQNNQQSQNSGYSSSQTGYNSQTFPSSSAQPPSTSYSQTSGSSSSSYHQAPSNTSYQSSSSYSTMSQPSAVSSSYPSSQQYQGSSQQQQQQQQQSYSASGGSTNYTPAASSTTGSQYQNSYGSNGPVTTATGLHAASSASAKLGSSLGSAASKDSQYDTPSTVANSSLGSSSAQGSSSVTPAALGLVSSAAQAGTNTASTKVTSSTAGVPPAMLGQHQYILGQQMPYFNVQQPIYGFEDYQHQLMQSRVPMQTSGFYDLNSLASRESGMTSVAYSVSDGRFARTDNNSSPVPSTLSQQQNPTQAHQQPMLNPSTLPPGYAYFYNANVVPGTFQYGTPALYQLPTATNAHGATNNTQYAKPSTYSSGYGSGYDSLSGQGTADYSKPSGGYVSAGSQGGQSSKGSVVGSAGSSASAAGTASDLTSNMYSKAHVALGKVNSYDKQGFHSGTPPPFNLPGSQTNQMGAAAAGYTPLFIPTLAPHQQLHQPLHQDSGSGSGQRSQPSSQQSKAGVKQSYNTSYWPQN